MKYTSTLELDLTQKFCNAGNDSGWVSLWWANRKEQVKARLAPFLMRVKERLGWSLTYNTKEKDSVSAL